jgi:mRNA interferase RelE/StbE
MKTSVQKDLRKIPSIYREAIEKKVDTLRSNPYPHGTEKIKGCDHFYRIRVSDYRILYEVREKLCVIVIITIGHRGSVYQSL